MRMLISWDWDQPVKCSEHGWLSDEPLPHHDAGILAIEHLRDVHGMNVDKALAKVEAHKVASPVVADA